MWIVWALIFFFPFSALAQVELFFHGPPEAPVTGRNVYRCYIDIKSLSVAPPGRRIGSRGHCIKRERIAVNVTGDSYVDQDADRSQVISYYVTNTDGKKETTASPGALFFPAGFWDIKLENATVIIRR